MRWDNKEWVMRWGAGWEYSQAMRTWALRLLVVPAELQATHWHQKSSGPKSSSTCWRVISMLASLTTKPVGKEWKIVEKGSDTEKVRKPDNWYHVTFTPIYMLNSLGVFYLARSQSMLMSVLDTSAPVAFPSVLWHALTLANCDCMTVSLALILEPKRRAVWVWALRGRILSVMANSILFANSTDYRSSGCQSPNKQIISKTNAFNPQLPLQRRICCSTQYRACVHILVCMCIRDSLRSELFDWIGYLWGQWWYKEVELKIRNVPF